MPNETVLTKPSAEQIAAILASHALWIAGKDGGSRANLTRANLTGADLTGADLTGADLTGADLYGADLYGANLTGADLTGANLTRANLTRANLTGANLTEAKGAALVLARTEIVPREGEVIGWKKCCSGVIVKVRVPPEAKRSNALGRKCRAEFVEVVEVHGAEIGVSLHDGKTTYAVGQTVKPDSWNGNRLEECAAGIHFYLTREEAEAHS